MGKAKSAARVAFKDNWTFIDLFAGIGGMRIPFEAMGGACVFSSEWDKSARQTYYHNFDEQPAGDITKIDAAEIPDHDVLLAGFPCQPFSIIGNKRGFADTRGTLFFEIERILRAKQPQAFLLENVKQLASHDKGRTFSTICDRLQKTGLCDLPPNFERARFWIASKARANFYRRIPRSHRLCVSNGKRVVQALVGDSGAG